MTPTPNQFALIVEDDFDASIIFAKALQFIGCQTEVIHNGEVALDRLGATVPNIVLLDLHLPNVTGADILQHIRADERLAETLVIIATADPRMAETIRHMADLVLLKPTTFSQVRDLSARLVKARQAARSSRSTGPLNSSNN